MEIIAAALHFWTTTFPKQDSDMSFIRRFVFAEADVAVNAEN